jgi:hypothetical protein
MKFVLYVLERTIYTLAAVWMTLVLVFILDQLWSMPL